MKWFPFLICAFIFGAINPVFASLKTEQVEKYLGTYRYERDNPIGTVKFIFQKAVLTRAANGRQSYKQLLTGQRGFTNDDNAGKLLAIQVIYSGKTSTIHPDPLGSVSKESPVDESPSLPSPSTGSRRSRRSQEGRAVPAQIVNEAPEPQTVVETEPIGPPAPNRAIDPVRPRSFYDQPAPGAGGSTGGISLPDSATVARNLDAAKQKVSGWKGQMWSSAQPIWEFVMWIFNTIIVLLICVGGLFRYIAKTAAAETRVNRKGRVVIGGWIAGAHQNASGLLLIITWVIAIFFLIDAFMWLIYLNLPIWTLAVIWFPLLWLAERLTSWIVPNLRGDEVG